LSKEKRNTYHVKFTPNSFILDSSSMKLALYKRSMFGDPASMLFSSTSLSKSATFFRDHNSFDFFSDFLDLKSEQQELI